MVDVQIGQAVEAAFGKATLLMGDAFRGLTRRNGLLRIRRTRRDYERCISLFKPSDETLGLFLFPKPEMIRAELCGRPASTIPEQVLSDWMSGDSRSFIFAFSERPQQREIPVNGRGDVLVVIKKNIVGNRKRSSGEDEVGQDWSEDKRPVRGAAMALEEDEEMGPASIQVVPKYTSYAQVAQGTSTRDDLSSQARETVKDVIDSAWGLFTKGQDWKRKKLSCREWMGSDFSRRCRPWRPDSRLVLRVPRTSFRP